MPHLQPNCESRNFITQSLADQIKIFQNLKIPLIIYIFLGDAFSYRLIWLENPKIRMDPAILLLFLFFSTELDSYLRFVRVFENN